MGIDTRHPFVPGPLKVLALVPMSSALGHGHIS
ncbi:hypothetical protein BCL80_101168 [Streptomyces avidinii]|uniref:Uncharacterized protein n=1 Tax=Streptomyces pratensis (strain ATCC 33331 / IAF-45CD) TaxID=591167 RepID=A0A8D3WHY5_STRFA|nr:hypothetical protein BCL80_101168 [Streptomyces avidinii]SNX71899.1 hypothetical protein SAMN05421860_101168 [Streptomyces microflavus]